jgi:hypothetical protein
MSYSSNEKKQVTIRLQIFKPKGRGNLVNSLYEIEELFVEHSECQGELIHSIDGMQKAGDRRNRSRSGRRQSRRQ